MKKEDLESAWGLGHSDAKRVRTDKNLEKKSFGYVFKYAAKTIENIPDYVLDSDKRLRAWQTSKDFYNTSGTRTGSVKKTRASLRPAQSAARCANTQNTASSFFDEETFGEKTEASTCAGSSISVRKASTLRERMARWSRTCVVISQTKCGRRRFRAFPLTCEWSRVPLNFFSYAVNHRPDLMGSDDFSVSASSVQFPDDELFLRLPGVLLLIAAWKARRSSVRSCPCISQHPDQVSKKFKLLVQRWHSVRNQHMDKIGFFKLGSYFLRKEYLTEPELNSVAVDTQKFPFRQEVADCYDTLAGVGVRGRGQPRIAHAKGLSPWLLWGGAALGIILLFVGIAAIPRLVLFFAKKQVAPPSSSAPSSSPVSVSRLMDSSAPAHEPSRTRRRSSSKDAGKGVDGKPIEQDDEPAFPRYPVRVDAGIVYFSDGLQDVLVRRTVGRSALFRRLSSRASACRCRSLGWSPTMQDLP